MNSIKYINYFEDDWNLILASDSYKVSHQTLLPDSLSSLESYGESRGGEYQEVAFTGFLPILRMIQGVQITKEKINEARWLTTQHFGSDQIFDYELWEYICDKYDGKLPIKIYAVPEGTIVKTSNILFKTVALEERFADLASYIETILMRVWYPITIGTNSGIAADIGKYYCSKTATENFTHHFLLHDFGSRGVTTREQAQYGGAMHLFSFKGSDNFDGIRFLSKHYDNTNFQNRFTSKFELKSGFSIPATEHLVMTIEGKENESNVYKRILQKYTSEQLKHIPLSIVSDTYNIYDVCRFVYDDLEIRNLILKREANTVFRPDSGDAFEVIFKMLEIFSSTFGFTYNEKGYKVLNNKIRIIQGDGIDLTSYLKLIQYFCDVHKWSIENFVFGSGGGLLQKFNRDTIQFAIKCSWASYKDGTEIDVYKEPITGKSKKSKKGKLWLFRIDGVDVTYNEKEMLEHSLTIEDSLMKLVFDSGDVLCDYSIEEVTSRLEQERERLNEYDEINNVDMHIKMNHDWIVAENKYISDLKNCSDDDVRAFNKRVNYYDSEIIRLMNL